MLGLVALLRLLEKGVEVVQGQKMTVSYTVLVMVTSLLWIFHSPASARELNATTSTVVLFMGSSSHGWC